MGKGLFKDALLATALASLVPGDLVLLVEAGRNLPAACGGQSQVALGPDASVLGLIDALSLLDDERKIESLTIAREGAISHLDLFRTLFASVADVPACEVAQDDFAHLAASARLVVVTGPEIRHPDVLVRIGGGQMGAVQQ